MAGSGWLGLRALAGPGWVRGSDPAVLSRLRDEAVVRPGFLSAAEEETLSRELEPELRRRRYEYDHWDAAIHGFRETEKSRWSEASRAILQRVRAAAFGPGQALLSPVHVLDLEPRGYVKPHVDSIKFCGATIAGLSLLSPSVMRLVHAQEPKEWLELLLEPGSLYILSWTIDHQTAWSWLFAGAGIRRGSPDLARPPHLVTRWQQSHGTPRSRAASFIVLRVNPPPPFPSLLHPSLQ
ncbi:alpha-ketoglutarate-dependent dioxygenase alkB homolog 7, mitochondrial isoform X1 [Choloepus didactylus]|uniref:alpha-ketoglutarate-dependent dioxygenase alkB homolog 7, mitochondrial isoform X1 n=1 Tax=Choloepus didactylus TaxID=27675 RepID=UPI00189DD5CB|nr:alpha-ketoglutarate-dependent dioxygenase alkB homolog 7, mitochondrial isoform X1 [Choloepus didactylus]